MNHGNAQHSPTDADCNKTRTRDTTTEIAVELPALTVPQPEKMQATTGCWWKPPRMQRQYAIANSEARNKHHWGKTRGQQKSNIVRVQHAMKYEQGDEVRSYDAAGPAFPPRAPKSTKITSWNMRIYYGQLKRADNKSMHSCRIIRQSKRQHTNNKHTIPNVNGLVHVHLGPNTRACPRTKAIDGSNTTNEHHKRAMNMDAANAGQRDQSNVQSVRPPPAHIFLQATYRKTKTNGQKQSEEKPRVRQINERNYIYPCINHIKARARVGTATTGNIKHLTRTFQPCNDEIS